jgi:hypothetical protein
MHRKLDQGRIRCSLLFRASTARVKAQTSRPSLRGLRAQDCGYERRPSGTMWWCFPAYGINSPASCSAAKRASAHRKDRSSAAIRTFVLGTQAWGGAPFFCWTRFTCGGWRNKCLVPKQTLLFLTGTFTTSLRSCLSRQRAVRIYARLLCKLVPRPDIAYLLDADPEAAFIRKPEYPLEFLKQYRRSYLLAREPVGGITLIQALPLEAAGRKVADEFKRVGICPPDHVCNLQRA